MDRCFRGFYFCLKVINKCSICNVDLWMFSESFLTKAFQMPTNICNTNIKHNSLFTNCFQYFRNKGLSKTKNQHYTIFKVLIMWRASDFCSWSNCSKTICLKSFEMNLKTIHLILSKWLLFFSLTTLF